MNAKRAFLATLAVLILVGVAWAAAPWSIFGSAQAVKMGQPPNPWAIKLPSILPDQPYSGVNFQMPDGSLLFRDIQVLSADFNVTSTDCGGGSPRFQIAIDMNGDGQFTQPPDGNVFVYFGPFPNFTGCPAGWQSTGNLITAPDLRFDTSQVGGTFYDSYANALALVGDKAVLGISLVVDGGWKAPQVVLVDNVTVNNFKLTAKGFGK
jgi:hypothetical protein